MLMKTNKKWLIYTLIPILLLIGIRVPYILGNWFPIEEDIVFFYIQYALTCIFAFVSILYLCKIINFVISNSGDKSH